MSTQAPRFAQHKRSPKVPATVAMCWGCAYSLQIRTKTWEAKGDDPGNCSVCGQPTWRRAKAEDVKDTTAADAARSE